MSSLLSAPWFHWALAVAIGLPVLLGSAKYRMGLASLQKTCFDVGEALAKQYFHSAPWVAWTDAGHRSLVIEEGEI